MGCKCGSVVRDQLIPNPIKAHLLSDLDVEAVWFNIFRLCGGYAEALQQGTERTWLSEHGFGDGYADFKLSLHSTFTEIAMGILSKANREVFQCEACGRLLIQLESELFATFAPENENSAHLMQLINQSQLRS